MTMTASPPAQSQRLSMAFIVVTLTLDAVGYGLIMPVLPDLMQALTGTDLAQAALWGGLMTGGFALAQFLCGPLLGNLSDRFGRKPVLLLSLAVLSADYLVMALAAGIWVVFAARLMSGMASSTYGTSMAFIADISTPAQKAQRFGLMGAAFGAGFVLGPAIGGLLAEYGTRAPFYAAAAVAALNAVFGLVAMRESLPQSQRRPFDWRRANPLGAFRHIGRLPGLGRYLTIYGAHEFAFIVFPAVWSYYTHARFGWSPSQIGLSLATYGIGFALVQGLLIRAALARLGRQTTMVLGFRAGIMAFSTLVWIENGTLALLLIPISSLSGLVMPALRAEMSDRVSPLQQGELQGALSSLHASAMIVAPFLYTGILAWFHGEWAIVELPGMVFFVPLCLNLYALYLVRQAQRRGSA